jgi:hypothetical protein
MKQIFLRSRIAITLGVRAIFLAATAFESGLIRGSSPTVREGSLFALQLSPPLRSGLLPRLIAAYCILPTVSVSSMSSVIKATRGSDQNH